MKKNLLYSIVFLFVFSTDFWTQNVQNPNRLERGTQSASSRNSHFLPYKVKRTKEQEKQLSPGSEDLLKYSEFLKQPKTGIFRLMNDIGCESNVYVIRVDEICKNVVPGGSFYSFREKGYTTAYLADIRLREGILVSDGVLSQNILVKLGDIPIDELSLESYGLKFLREFVPESESSKATSQFMQIVRGVRTNGYEYRKALPVTENATYAMRLIAYRGNIYRNFRGWVFNLLDGDERVDMTVVFRVIRKEDDGDITVIWKQLERKKSPKLKSDQKHRPKVEKPQSDPGKMIAEG